MTSSGELVTDRTKLTESSPELPASCWTSLTKLSIVKRLGRLTKQRLHQEVKALVVLRRVLMLWNLRSCNGNTRGGC